MKKTQCIADLTICVFSTEGPKTSSIGAVVVAQLVERLLPTPEICGSNPDIGKTLTSNCKLEKTKIKKKRPGMAHLKKTNTKHLL